MHVILGEVVPKSIALQNAEQVALAVAGPLDFFITIFSPVTRTMAASSRWVLHSFGWSHIREGGVHTPEELKLSVTASHRYGLICALQQDLLHRALDLETITVREIMVPRPDIFSLPGNMPLEEAAARVVEEQHSRVPVYDAARGPEAIIGVLYSKDLMRWMQFRLHRASPQPPMSQPKRAPPPKPMPRSSRSPSATSCAMSWSSPKPSRCPICSTNSNTAAAISPSWSMSSALPPAWSASKMSSSSWSAKSKTSSTTWPAPSTAIPPRSCSTPPLTSAISNPSTICILPRDEGFETLAGFVVARLQRIPKPGDSFLYQQRRFTVLEMEGRRVGAVKVDLLPASQSSASEEKSGGVNPGAGKRKA